MLKRALTGVCLCAAAVAAADVPDLSSRQISDLVAGATVEIDTPLGTKLPVRYGPNGQVTGEARGLAWYLGAAVDTGRWWVAADQLCHKWTRWFNAEPQCMRLSRDGRLIRWRSQDGNTGTAVVTVQPAVQAATVLALPRPQPKRMVAPAYTAAAPAAATLVEAAPDAPPEQAAATPAAAPDQPSPPASWDTAAVTAFAPLVVPAPVAAVRPPPSPPKQAEARQGEPRQAEPKQAESKQTESRQAAPAQAEPKRASLFMVANVRQDDVLNVRSGPSADHDIVGELQPGSRGIAVTSACRSQWCPVQHRSGASGWVNSAYLAPEQPQLSSTLNDGPADPAAGSVFRDSAEAPRSCLTPAARALLDRIEQTFGRVQVVSTCRPGARIAGTGRISRHASGNAVDFKAGARKGAIVEWLIATHHIGGTMTYSGMDHIHVDIGPHFVSLAGGRHWSSWHHPRRDAGRRDDPGRTRQADSDDD